VNPQIFHRVFLRIADIFFNKIFFIKANGMTKTQGHSLDTQSPSQINQFSQPLTLDTSEPTTQKHLENFTQNELRHEEAQEIPLDFR